MGVTLSAGRCATLLGVVLSAALSITGARAADLSPAPRPTVSAPAEVVPVRPPLAPPVAVRAEPVHSLFFFAGRLSTTSMGDTALFNINAVTVPHYDNMIIGAAYQRDIWRWRGFRIGAEIGIADRFGTYHLCCGPETIKGSVKHSGELWGGIVLGFDGILLFNTVRVAPSVVLGLSAITNSIGVERQREAAHSGNAHLLFYLAPELALSIPRIPNVEAVMRLHHRSGWDGTLGNMREGYNAYVFGVRWRF
ncbi:MAG: hypothetical protein IT536_04035 [Hyphomicrobiales bacterium]|nr:hypothetical protein [Hyphomicrobiales bacterium]